MFGSTRKENITEAKTKPMMNLGKRYQISIKCGLAASGFRSMENVDQIARKKAAKPIKTF